MAAFATASLAAVCDGPRGPFTTTVRSARDGRVVFVQRFPDRPSIEAGIALGGAWRVGADGEVIDSLAAAERAILRGHEFHLLAIAPESRFHAPTATAQETLAGQPVHVVGFRDPGGGRVEFLYRVDTGLPLGFRLLDPPGSDPSPILTLFDDWSTVGSVRLPFQVTIHHGAQVFRYRVTDASVEWVPDEAFGPAAAAQVRSHGFHVVQAGSPVEDRGVSRGAAWGLLPCRGQPLTLQTLDTESIGWRRPRAATGDQGYARCAGAEGGELDAVARL